jgi:hypothetical protein
MAFEMALQKKVLIFGITFILQMTFQQFDDT